MQSSISSDTKITFYLSPEETHIKDGQKIHLVSATLFSL